MPTLDPDRRRLLLAGGGAALAFAAMPAAACTLAGSPPPRRHSDPVARAAIRTFVAVANKGEQASHEEIAPYPLLFAQADGTNGQYLRIVDWLSFAGRRDDRPAVLRGVARLAAGGRKAIYLVQVARYRYAPAREANSCFGPTAEGYYPLLEVWLFRFQDRRLTSVRQLPELAQDYDELIP